MLPILNYFYIEVIEIQMKFKWHQKNKTSGMDDIHYVVGWSQYQHNYYIKL